MSHRFNLHIPDDIYEKIKLYQNLSENRSLTSTITELLDYALSEALGGTSQRRVVEDVLRSVIAEELDYKHQRLKLEMADIYNEQIDEMNRLARIGFANLVAHLDTNQSGSLSKHFYKYYRAGHYMTADMNIDQALELADASDEYFSAINAELLSE